MSEEPIAWIAMPYRVPVLDAGGHKIGPAESLLGDEAEDIFHGIVVKRHSDGHLVEILSSQVTVITETHVQTSITEDGVSSLPEYSPEKWLHIEWGGLFRKHPQWRVDK